MEKRIELHCHTLKSEMDAVSSPREIVEYAYKMGLGGVAITDHASIQAFTEAEQVYKEISDSNFKLMYGMEAYLCDDEYGVVYNDKGQSLDNEYVAIDIETTGFSPENNEIVEIAAIKFDNNGIKESFCTYVNPERNLPDFIVELIGLSDDTLKNAPTIKMVFPKLMEFCKDAVIVGHGLEFEKGFLLKEAKEMKLAWNNTMIDTKAIAMLEVPEFPKYTLEDVVKALEVVFYEEYSCMDCAKMVTDVFLKLQKRLKKKGIVKLSQIKEIAVGNTEYIKKKGTYHATIIVRNQIGMENLKKIVEEANNKYFEKQSIVPKSLLSKYREGLLIGAGCEAGELFQTLVNGNIEEDIERIQQYYDYFEIQPIENNSFMIESLQYEGIDSEEDLKALNKKILELGKKYEKVVIATGDVHYAKKEEAYKRRDMFVKRGFKNPIFIKSLYLHDAEEMLSEFEYLGMKTAEKVVIHNPKGIVDLISDVEVNLKIRQATLDDLEAITEMEAQCFPAAEAATRESFKKRLSVFANHFWLLEKDGKVISGINGMVVNETTLTDEMYADATMHDENGGWQMILGVTTLPKYQRNGYASLVMKRVISDCKEQERKGIVLTCKEKLIKFYEQFGFVNEGESQSEHGGATWYELRLLL